MYLKARDLHPGLGRFLTPDPLGVSPGTVATSHYANAGNSPVVNVDPTGLATTDAKFIGFECSISADRTGSSLGYCSTASGASAPISTEGVGNVLNQLQSGRVAEVEGNYNHERFVAEVLFQNAIDDGILVAKPGGGGGTYFGAAHCYIDCFDGGPVLDTASQALLGANLDKELVSETMIEGSNFGAEGAAFAAAAIGASGNAVPGRAYHDLWNDPAKNRTHANAIPPTTTGPTPNAPNGLADDALRLACSFSAETEVLMADGTTKPIADVKVGDWVLAVDPRTGERGPREVTHLWIHQDTLIDLDIDGHDVATTEDHPFWNATDGEWQRADALDRGDLLVSADGDLLTVGGLDRGSARTANAYNLTVDGIHTYFVQAGDEEEVLVHNICGDDLVSDILKTKKGSIRNAELPPGSPSFDDILDMPFSQIEAGARANLPGYKTIKKLLTDGRFNR